MEFIYICITGIISIYLFTILFEKSKVFVPVQKFTRKLKRKGLYSYIISFIFIVIILKSKDYFSLNAITIGIVSG